MRLRNIPGADDAIEQSVYCVKEPETHKGYWQEAFETTQPLHIEIGMGKGRFIMDLAAANPDINYLGIERYSSVLLRALQKMEQNPLHGCSRCRGRLRSWRSRSDLPQFLRPMAEGPPR